MSFMGQNIWMLSFQISVESSQFDLYHSKSQSRFPSVLYDLYSELQPLDSTEVYQCHKW